MSYDELVESISQKQSLLCVGLDPDLSKIPSHLLSLEDPLFEFCKSIIDATSDVAVAYKPNTALFEALGAKGWLSLQKTLDYIPQGIFKLVDAKRGDIGNTSSLYAKAFYDHLHADALTVAPYMGHDSVKPFLAYEGKWVVLLALTSNDGSSDFQLKPLQDQTRLFEHVITTSQTWGTKNNLMYVVGATRGEELAAIRRLAPYHFLLVPGIGAQGGSSEEVIQYGLSPHFGLLINSSRVIIYASPDRDFMQAARNEALTLVTQMRKIVRF